MNTYNINVSYNNGWTIKINNNVLYSSKVNIHNNEINRAGCCNIYSNTDNGLNGFNTYGEFITCKYSRHYFFFRKRTYWKYTDGLSLKKWLNNNIWVQERLKFLYPNLDNEILGNITREIYHKINDKDFRYNSLKVR